MMYTNFDLIELETMDNEQLSTKLVEAKENYEYVQSLYEGENDNTFEHKIKLEIVFMHLKNVENYIRRIENLLHEYEKDRVFIRKAINRRNKRLSRLGNVCTV